MMRPIMMLTIAVWSAAHADSWRPPSAQAKASESGQFVVRVVPGKSMGDVYGFGGEPTGPYARAEWHRFDGKSYVNVIEKTLLNPIAPVDIIVSNTGVLVTLDNWHNVGVGNAVVIYSTSGDLVKKYTLRDLYSIADLGKMQKSVSSIHWRCFKSPALLASDTTLLVDDSIGGRFIFRVEGGSFEYQAGRGTCNSGPP